MQRDLDWEIIAKYLAEECSESEKKEVEGNPELMEQVRILRTYLNERFHRQGVASRWDIESALETVHNLGRIPDIPDFVHSNSSTIKENRDPSSSTPAAFKEKSYIGSLLRIAAVIVMLIGSSYVALNFRSLFWQKPATESLISVSTGRGEQKQLLLADGSKVTLNSETTVRFSKSFGRVNRDIDLVGEAFFVVAHKKVPFIVHTRNGTVEDLSTEFNVKAWPGEKETEVVVKKGNVILRDGIPPKGRGVIVRAGEISRASPTGAVIPPVKASLQLELAWLNGSLVFRETPLRKVITELGRKYPYSFVASDPSLLSKKLTASFRREPFDEILKAIMISLDIRYEKKGNTIFLIPGTQRAVSKATKQRD